MFLSTTTMTGQQIARNNLQYVDGVFYFPFDLGFVVERTLRLVKPRLFIMMETEIWPNLLRACRRAGVKTMLVNGRISARSYPRYRLARAVLPPRPRAHRSLLHAERRVGAPDHRHRGAERERVSVTGSLKFDSLEFPAGADERPRTDRGRNRVLRYFRVAPIARS